LSSTMPLISRAVESIDIRFLKVIWILFLVPIATFLLMYIYPKMEKKSREQLIEMELPFATIHMSAIAGSLISPIKIFEIIVSTNEYPHLQKEFTKMINEVNLYGSDLVSALKNTARNNPSKRLSELLNGLATTINSGGDLPKFFDKRSETLLFEYKLTKDKQNKAAETFMDIYISVVIAAPMILMLLLMIMKISGLGMSASIGTITLMMVVGVAIVNIGFLSFLNLKRKVV
jgi:archaeal flagellar protein FlaJ